MSTQYVSNTSDYGIHRDRSDAAYISGAKLRSLEIMAIVLAVVMTLGPMFMAARSVMY
jgi:hypothetical protein